MEYHQSYCPETPIELYLIVRKSSWGIVRGLCFNPLHKVTVTH